MTVLNTLDTIRNYPRPVFSLGVSQHMLKITNLWKFDLNWSSKWQDNNGRKNTNVTQSCVLSDAWFRDLKFVESYFFLENYVTSEEAVSHNVLYYQQLPITRYQVRFYTNNYFEYLPIASSALKYLYQCILFHVLPLSVVAIILNKIIPYCGRWQIPLEVTSVSPTCTLYTYIVFKSVNNIFHSYILTPTNLKLLCVTVLTCFDNNELAIIS